MNLSHGVRNNRSGFGSPLFMPHASNICKSNANAEIGNEANGATEYRYNFHFGQFHAKYAAICV